MSTPVQDRRAPGSRRGRRDRPELLVDREYAASRDEVLRTVRAKLQAAGVELDDGDLEAAYNQAWHALYLMLADGEWIENRIAMLVTITHRRSLDDHRAQRVDRRTELPPDLPAPHPDVERRLDDQRRLRALRSGMRERLSGRELQAATLCYIHQRSRPEAAEIMGLSPRRMEKIMDRVSKRFGALVRDVQGDWCATQDSLVLAYALGTLDPDGERHRLAVDHLEDCSSCRRRVLGLRGLAAVAPPLPLLLGGVGPAGGGAGGGDRAEGNAAGGAGAAAAGGVAGARGGGRGLGRLGRGSTRTNLVAAAAVTAAVAVAATAIALSRAGSGPGDGARPDAVTNEAGSAGAGTGGAGADGGNGAASGPSTSGADRGSTRDGAAGRPGNSSGGTVPRPPTTAKRPSRADRTSPASSPASTSTSSSATASRAPGSAASRPAAGTGSTGTGSTTTPSSAPARPSSSAPSPSPNGDGSAPVATPKAPPKIVDDGAEEFELH